MKTSGYDKVSATLSAALMLLGAVTLLLFLIWLGQNIRAPRPIVPVTMELEGLGGGGSGNGQEGPQEQELEEPSPEELKLVEPNITETLESVTDVVSTQALEIDSVEAATSGFGKGEGPGRGDGRGLGPGGPGGAKQLPDWEVRFQGGTLEVYADQLDHFGIELAVLGGGKKGVEYASNFRSPKPTARGTDGKGEGRRYLIWRKGGGLQEADRTFLNRAGIDHSARIILQFLPQNVERDMAIKEATHAKGRRLDEIKRTVFGVRGSAGNWEMYVLEQNYRF